MRTPRIFVRAALAVLLATTSFVAIGCGDDDAAVSDAGGGTDSGRMDVDSGARDAGGAMGSDAGADAGSVTADAGPGVDAATTADAGANPLTILPPSPMATGCSVDTVTFTASGGTPPYTFSTSEGGTTNLTVVSPTSVRWTDGSDNFCGMGGSVTITVTDSAGAMTSAIITVLPG